jgi:hypothetical protein
MKDGKYLNKKLFTGHEVAGYSTRESLLYMIITISGAFSAVTLCYQTFIQH